MMMSEFEKTIYTEGTKEFVDTLHDKKGNDFRYEYITYDDCLYSYTFKNGEFFTSCRLL